MKKTEDRCRECGKIVELSTEKGQRGLLRAHLALGTNVTCGGSWTLGHNGQRAMIGLPPQKNLEEN